MIVCPANTRCWANAELLLINARPILPSISSTPCTCWVGSLWASPPSRENCCVCGFWGNFRCLYYSDYNYTVVPKGISRDSILLNVATKYEIVYREKPGRKYIIKNTKLCQNAVAKIPFSPNLTTIYKITKIRRGREIILPITANVVILLPAVAKSEGCSGCFSTPLDFKI